jgi:hypothetical protein
MDFDKCFPYLLLSSRVSWFFASKEIPCLCEILVHLWSQVCVGDWEKMFVNSCGIRCWCSNLKCLRNKSWKVYSTSVLQRKRSHRLATLKHVSMQQEEEQQSLENKDSPRTAYETTTSSIHVENQEKDLNNAVKQSQQQAEEKLQAAKAAEEQAQQAEQQHEALHATSSGKERAAALRIEAEQLRLQAERARLYSIPPWFVIALKCFL